MSRAEAAPPVRAALEARMRDDAERNRLLYVALTRAESWLIVAAAGRPDRTGEKRMATWYGAVEDGLRTLGAAPLDRSGARRHRSEARTRARSTLPERSVRRRHPRSSRRIPFPTGPREPCETGPGIHPRSALGPWRRQGPAWARGLGEATTLDALRRGGSCTCFSNTCPMSATGLARNRAEDRRAGGPRRARRRAAGGLRRSRTGPDRARICGMSSRPTRWPRSRFMARAPF
jgi:hypothetical protein